MRRLKRPPSRLRSPEKATRRRTAKATQTSGISFETSRQEKMQDLHQTDGAMTLCALPLVQCFDAATRRVGGPIRKWRRKRSCSSCSKGSVRAVRTPSCSGVSKLCTPSTRPTIWMVKITFVLFVFILFFNDAPLCRLNPTSYVPAVSLRSVPTFASFLKEVESPYEVHDYVRAYLGDTPEAKDFAKQFLERRAKQNANQQKPAQQNQQQALKQQQVRGAEVEPPVTLEDLGSCQWPPVM